MGAALEAFLERFVDACRAGTGGLPRHLHDPAWPSPCERGEPDGDGEVAWQPQARERPPDFSGLERALEQPLHPALAAFYGSFLSDSVPARAEEGALTLIQVWSDPDFDRLVENLLGHALAKRRARAPLTLFVACTDEDDLVLSVDNAGGEVVLERPGRTVLRTVASDLAGFLDRLEPAPGG